jgi:hypothetical protein
MPCDGERWHTGTDVTSHGSGVPALAVTWHDHATVSWRAGHIYQAKLTQATSLHDAIGATDDPARFNLVIGTLTERCLPPRADFAHRPSRTIPRTVHNSHENPPGLDCPNSLRVKKQCHSVRKPSSNPSAQGVAEGRVCLGRPSVPWETGGNGPAPVPKTKEWRVASGGVAVGRNCGWGTERQAALV